MRKILLFLLINASLWAQTEGVIDSAGSKLYFRTFGSGEPLLIINGGPGMSSNGFTELAGSLSKNRMVILYDQRGTGRSVLSKVSPETITMDLMVEDIESLRRHLNIKRWNVLGHSFGGMLASYYVSKFPQSIEKVIFSSSGGVDLGLLEYVGQKTNALLTERQRDSLNYWNAKIASGDNSYETAIGRGRALAPAYVYDKTKAEIIARRLTEGNSSINGLVWQNLRKIRFDATTTAANFKREVLVIQGRNDLLEIETAEKIARSYPNSKLVLLEYCGHYGWLDRPAEYFNEIEKFLT